MARDLKLEVILQAVDRATRPIRSIMQGSVGLGRTLKETRDTLKDLQAQQKDVSSWRAMRAAADETDTALAVARDRVKALSQGIAGVGVPTRQMTRDFKAAIREATALKKQHQEQQIQLQGLRGKLGAAGISTRNLGEHERDLRQRIIQTSESISQQGKRMEALTRQQRRLAQAKADFQKSQQLAGSLATGGAAGLASGYAIAKPIQSMIEAFSPAENAATQLKVAMMGSDGSVAADFEKITALANSLGDRLPGTTADFQEMMTMLRRQGISAQSILGGTGEAAAYLGVQLQMPATAAAEFAAKMQDATRTSEKDMLGLMDTIQRAYYIGMDSGNMLQGFTKLSPVMGIIKKDGLEAANALAPLLVMMDQTGMAGESAGNAIRKVFQSGMDAKRFGKANAALRDMKAGFGLDFTNGKGEFGGLENLFDQLEKLKKLTSVQRTSVMKELFGDDSETLQVVNTLMTKGMAGYQEVAAKMQAQADLRKRVNEQLETLTNTMEAASGSWSNAMAEIGATIAPELKELITGFGNMANSLKAWVKENPRFVGELVKVAAGIAVLLAAGGGISIMLASILGPLAMVRYGMTLFGIKSLGMATGLKGVGSALLWVGKAVLWIGRALLMNPIGLAITAIAAAAYLIYKYWEPIKGFFAGLWDDIKAGFTSALNFISGLVGRFSAAGTMLMQGIVQGISNGLAAVKGAITGAADSTVGWFKDKLGIHSPSRVFAQLGGFTMAGLEQGLLGGQSGPLAAVASLGKQLAAAGALTLGMGGTAIAMDNRPPLGASRAPAAMSAAGPMHVTININGAGMDANSIAQAVSAELAKLQRVSQARARSSLSDQE